MVLFGKSARKKRIPPPRSRRKILVPTPRSHCQKWVPPPRLPEAYQGSRGELRERGIQGGGGIARKGYLALFCFFFCVCKKWIPPPLGVSVKFWYSPSKTLLETGTPPSKRTTPPLTRNSEQSLRISKENSEYEKRLQPHPHVQKNL